mmetsp:Transcript_26316/g.46678  ORF Transcript_26316/g.46678 Transcript_26316/m.46678 type:complete len:174 (-) Transcript_26316:177-698(-)
MMGLASSPGGLSVSVNTCTDIPDPKKRNQEPTKVCENRVKRQHLAPLSRTYYEPYSPPLSSNYVFGDIGTEFKDEQEYEISYRRKLAMKVFQLRNAEVDVTVRNDMPRLRSAFKRKCFVSISESVNQPENRKVKFADEVEDGQLAIYRYFIKNTIIDDGYQNLVVRSHCCVLS